MASKKRNGPADLATKVLIQIRDELRAVKEEQRGMKAEQHATNQRLDRLEKRQTEDSIRLATEIVAVAKAIGEVRDLLRDQRHDRERIDDHERRLQTIERRIV